MASRSFRKLLYRYFPLVKGAIVYRHRKQFWDSWWIKVNKEWFDTISHHQRNKWKWIQKNLLLNQRRKISFHTAYRNCKKFTATGCFKQYTLKQLDTHLAILNRHLKKNSIRDKYIMKLASRRRWEGIYLPHCFALPLNVCLCSLILTWFKDLCGPKRPDWNSEISQTLNSWPRKIKFYFSTCILSLLSQVA